MFGIKIRRLGSTDLEVTELCFGILPLGPLQKNIDGKMAVSLLEKALDHGIQFFDTAESYKTQSYLGKAILGRRREELVLATKSHASTYEDMEASVRRSLSELGTDYIDIYHLHAAKADAGVFEDRAGALKCLLDMKLQGKIKAVGISTHSIAVVKAAARRNDIDVIFPIINKLGLGILDGTKEQMVEAIAVAATSGKGIYAMKALAGGHLGSEAKVAIDYVRQISGISSVAVGMVNEAELACNLELFEHGQISAGAVAAVKSQPKRLLVNATCIGCGACVAVCPNNALRIVNQRAQVDHERCILCGYCNPVCPEFALRIA